MLTICCEARYGQSVDVNEKSLEPISGKHEAFPFGVQG